MPKNIIQSSWFPAWICYVKPVILNLQKKGSDFLNYVMLLVVYLSCQSLFKYLP